VLVQTQVRPWIEAGAVTEAVAGYAHWLTADARPGSVLQVAHLPDNYRSADIFRNGIDAILLLRQGTALDWWVQSEASPLPALPAPLERDVYRLELARVGEAEYRIARAEALTLDATTTPGFPEDHWIGGLLPRVRSLPAPIGATAWQWDARACAEGAPPASARWTGLVCVDGRGLAGAGEVVFEPGASFSAPADWMRMVVSVAWPGGEGAALELAGAPGGHRAVPLPSGPFEGRVHFFVPRNAPGTTSAWRVVYAGEQPIVIRGIDLVMLPAP
jgi:hypothetical protein